MKKFLLIVLVLALGVAGWFWWTGTPVKPALEKAKDEIQQVVHTGAQKLAENTTQGTTVPATVP